MKYNETVPNYSQKIKFIIGFAGSGKSTKLAELCKSDNTLVLTPTHQAARVLESKGIDNVFTIHSVLKLVPTIDQNFRRGQKLQRLRQIGNIDLTHIKKIAIDEFSMISTTILDMLLAILPEDTKVYIFGDASQLKPVDGSPIDPEEYTSDIEKLTIQHRAEAPEVVETFMRFHHYIETGREMNLVVNIQKGSIESFNPKTDRILTYTNDRVVELNTIVANILGLPDEISESEDILVGGIDAIFVGLKDSITIYPTCIAKGRLMDKDKLMLAVTKTKNDIDKYNTTIPYPMATVDIDGDLYCIHYDTQHYKTSKKLKAEVELAQHSIVEIHNLNKDVHLPSWCKSNPLSKGVKERGEAWGKFLAHQNLVFDLRRPFVTTVHKSQGKEFDTVFIDQNDIKKSIHNNYYDTYARLMYVALSRAIKKVIII